jgi:hypothetical protein
MEYTNFISEIAKNCGYKSYLELGVSKGENLHYLQAVCPITVGVDKIDIRVYYDFEFHLMTTNDFFKINKKTFDLIFIDADHSFEQCKIDFANSIKILNRFGTILLHDTDPLNEDYLKSNLCGDSYRITDWIQTNHPHMDMLTLPFSVTGLSLVNRIEDRRIFEYLDKQYGL